VALLPKNPEGNNEKEWALRQETTNRILSYLKDKELINVFEIGSGNGWFSNALTKAIPNATVYGIDVNTKELEQGAKVFAKNNRYRSVYWDIFEPQSFLPKPGLIIFNASFQYFKDPKMVVSRCFELLKAYGEIHIIDSPFYSPTKALEAKKKVGRVLPKNGLSRTQQILFSPLP
jgi:trans-aconitate methyltransferase